MNAILLLSVLALGQCSGGVCSSPSMMQPTFAPSYFAPVQQPQPQLVAEQPIPARPKWPARSEWAWHSTVVDGKSRWVWGWREGENIRWFRAEQPPTPPSAMLAAFVQPTAREPETPAKPTPEPEVPPPANLGTPANLGSSNLGTPPNAVGALPAFATHGVDRNKLALRAGYQTRHDAAQRFVESEVKADTKVPDDRDKPRLTIIGAKADTGPVMALVKGDGALSKLAAQMHVQEYEPSSPYVKDLGFFSGKPSITVQAASGRVLHRQADFTGGEPALVAAIERSGALRKPDPAYDPAKDPDHREAPWSLGSLDLATHWPWLLLGLAVIFAALKPKPASPS